MPKNTRLPGHGLQDEGKPFTWNPQRENWYRAYGTSEGVAVCSCGEVSQTLHSDAERKRWMNAHKDGVRAASQPEED